MTTVSKERVKSVSYVSPRDIFLSYQKALSGEVKAARKHIDGFSLHDGEALSKENMALLLTICKLVKCEPQDLGITVWFGKIMGETTKTTNVLARLVAVLFNLRFEDLLKEAKRA